MKSPRNRWFKLVPELRGSGKEAQTLLAVRYNDKSPLENMHCAFAFELMKDQESGAKG